MYRSLLLLLFGCWFLVSQTSCSRNTLRITDTNFLAEIELAQNLVFEFNRPVVKKVSDRWVNEELITFEPAVAGRFKWIDEDKLVFSPATSFKPSTNYVARAGKGLEKWSKGSVESEAIPFHTPLLQLIEVQPYWGIAQKAGKASEARTLLRFNYPVVIKEVNKRLTIQSKNKKLTAIPLQTDGLSDQLTVVIPELPPSDEVVDIEFFIAKDLACPNSNYKTTETLRYACSFPSSEKIAVVKAEAAVHEGLPMIHVQTTHTIKADQNINDLIQVKPTAEYGAETTPLALTIEPTDNGCWISGPFNSTQGYELSIDAALTGIIGEPMGEAFQEQISFGNDMKVIQFVSDKSLYLSSAGFRNVALKINQVPEITVKVAKIYENNIQAFLRNNQYYSYGDGGDHYYRLTDYYNLEYFGDVIEEKKIPTNMLGKYNDAHLLKLDFNDQRQKFDGIYVIEVSSTEDYYVRALKVVSITDIGLMAKKAQDRVYVFAHSLHTAEPLKGASIQLQSSNNQTVFQAMTNSSGVAIFDKIQTGAAAFDLSMVTAHYQNDFNYLIFDHTRVSNSRFDVGGKPVKLNYDAFIYAEREVYRPGETAHLNAIVRGIDWNIQPEMPVYYKVLYPTGDVFREIKGTLNSFGAFETAINFPADMVTGNYVVELYTGSDELLQSINLSVEEFVPDRIKVQVATNTPQAKVGQTVNFDIKAEYLFGAPAANRTFEATIDFKPQPFSPKAFPNYEFTLHQTSSQSNWTEQGNLDDAGKATLPITVPENLSDYGLMNGNCLVSVFDESGRPVMQMGEVAVQTQSVFYGIQRFDSYVSAQQVMQIPIVALDAQGKPLSNVYAKVQVVKKEWESNLERINGEGRFQSKLREQVVLDKLLPIQGQVAALAFRPDYSGEYEVRVMRPGARNDVRYSFYAYGMGLTAANSFAINTDGYIDIVTSVSKSTVGDKIDIIFKTPFDGKLIVTTEQQAVFDVYQLETQQHAAQLTIRLKDEHVPNIYIVATLFRPMVDDRSPFTVAHGFASVLVDNPRNQLPIQIAAPKECRSRTRQTVNITAQPDAEITVAVVDEGILQLRDTPTPNPYEYFYAKRALTVGSHDIYGYLAPEIGNAVAMRKQSTGGGGMYENKRRVNPMANDRVKPFSVWSGRLRTNGQGFASFSFDVPAFSGQLRVMVAGYRRAQFGAASHSIRVVDPLVIETALPRFLSPNDTVDLRIRLVNTTAQSISAQMQLQTTGAIGISLQPATTAVIAPKSETRVLARVFGKSQIGEGEVKLVVSALNEKFTEVTALHVRPTASLQQKHTSGPLLAGRNYSLEPPPTNWITNSRRARLIISRSPLVVHAKVLKELIEYPHGCLEQTIAKAFPQLYLADVLRSMSLQVKDQPEQNVQAAIAKVQALQRYTGGFSLWPATDESDEWVSVFATHFLFEAQRAGFDVSKRTLERSTAYLQSLAGGYANTIRQETPRPRWGNAAPKVELAKRQAIYALYVLTLMGNKPIALMNYFKGQSGKLTPDSRYLLACTYQLIGDQVSFQQLRPASFGNMAYARNLTDDYASPIRDKALILNTLIEVSPEDGQIAALSQSLAQQMNQVKSMTTQEQSFALLALGKLARKGINSQAKAVVRVNQQPVAELKGQSLNYAHANLLGQQVQIEVIGQGQLFYWYEVSGIPFDGQFVPRQQQLRIKRTYLNRNGQPLNTTTFTQNDLIVVKLTVETANNEPVPNVVLSDMLPAGLEAENPRLASLPELKWLADNPTGVHRDYRDDRVHIFTDLKGGTAHYYYLARAVTLGKFNLGTVSAEAMYDPSYYAIAGGGKINVVANNQPVAQR
jgi:alpha-2-macroglobulin